MAKICPKTNKNSKYAYNGIPSSFNGTFILYESIMALYGRIVKKEWGKKKYLNVPAQIWKRVELDKPRYKRLKLAFFILIH